MLDLRSILADGPRNPPLSDLTAWGGEVGSAFSRRGRSSLTARLADALARDLVTVHFQPIVRLADGRLEGAEALSRWTDPELGVIPPSTFLPLIEGTELGDQLALRTWSASLDLAAHWRLAGGASSRRIVSVNFGPRQLQSAAFCERAISAVTARRLPPERIQIEVLESTVVTDSRVIANLEALRAAGLRIAFDDFGTGYAGLQSLARLPVDTIKIDRSFVAGARPSSVEAAVIAAVVSLAGTLGKAVVAEGIETEAQRDYLQSVGCRLGQGHLFSRAVPRTALAA